MIGAGVLRRLLAAVWLRAGSVRTVPLGSLRGVRFALRGAMLNRRDVFYRGYEPDVGAWLAAEVRPRAVVYVVGAHVGIHVLYLAKLLRGQGRIAAFEGWAENVALLREHVALNAQLHAGEVVEIVPAAVSDHVGTLRMARGASDGKHHVADSGDKTDTQTVQAVTLDSYWTQHPDCPTLLLIDVEGHEEAVLNGAAALIAACKPVLILEHHDSEAALRAWLAAHDYAVSNTARRHLLAKPQTGNL